MGFAGLLLLAAASCSKHSAAPNYNSDKTALNAAIDSLTKVYNNSVEGTKPGTYAIGAREALDSSIQLAKQVTASSQFTQQEVNNALNSLLHAADQFNNRLLQQVSAANLVGYWLFSGNALDSSGNGHNGALKTGWVGTSAATVVDGGTLPVLVADRFGRANKAYYFNNGATVQVPYSADLNPQSFTILLWVRRDGTNANNYMFSFNRWDGYKFQLQSGNLPFLTVQTTTGYHDVDDGGTPVDGPNTWVHLAVSFTPGTEKFYINGRLIRTASVTGTPIPVPSGIDLVIGNELPKTAYNLTDNSNPHYFWGADFFIGGLDDIRFYNTTLTDAQVLSIYTDESTL
jgi:hypothetical protein